MAKQKRKLGMVFPSVLLALISLVALVTPCLSAEDPDKYPSKPINMIIQWAAGGTTDLTGRKLSELVGKILGQPIVPVNKTGGGGVIAATAIASAPPDGYTIGTVTWGSMVYAPHMRQVPYKTLEDFTYVMEYAEIPQLFGVLAKSPWKSFKDYLEDAKKAPGKLTYAAAGPQTGQHIFMMQVEKIDKVKVTHVPTAGGAEVVSKLLGGHLDAGFVNELIPHVKNGEMRGLAFHSDTRLPYLPDVPTFKELGYQDEPCVWMGIYAPKGIDPKIFNKLYGALKKAQEDPSFQDLLAKLYMTPRFKDTQNFTEMIRMDYVRNEKVMREFGIIK